jgi:hypothetical protein
MDSSGLLNIDQNITRYQMGGGYNYADNLIFKVEFLMDRYEKEMNNKRIDSFGVITGLNMLF